MATTDKTTLKSWFKNKLKPTQEQFWAWMDSYWHKSEQIPSSQISGLDNLLAGVATTEQVDAVETSLEEEIDTKVDKVAGKQLSTEDFTTALKNKLDVLDLTKKLDTGGYTGTAQDLYDAIQQILPGNIDITNVSGLVDALAAKVDKVAGKQLSTEDFTTLLKQKLEAIDMSTKLDRGNYVGTAEDLYNEIQNIQLPGTDDNAIHKNVSNEIATISEKTAPVGADLVIIEDSENSFSKKKAKLNSLIKIEPYNTSASLLKAMEPPLIRNVQRNNMNYEGETRWQITAINTTAKTITFNRSLPLEINPNISPLKWGCYVNYYELVDVAAVDYGTNTITYTDMVGVLNVGENVFFFNPFRSFEFGNAGNYLTINNNLAPNQYNQILSLWKHSDGTYRAWIGGGVTSVKYGAFLASSPDLIIWTGINGTVQQTASGSWTKPWNNGEDMFFAGMPIRIGNSNNFICSVNARDTSGNWNEGIVVFDEDGGIKHVSSGFFANCAQGGIAYYGGEYYLYRVERIGSLNQWVTKEAVLSDLDLLTVKREQTLEWTRAVNNMSQSPFGNHVDFALPFVFNDVLYLFLGGTSLLSDNTNILSGNREYSVAFKNNGFETFSIYEQNPVICNPIEGETLWGANILWSTDHNGGFLNFLIEGNTLYVFMAMNDGTNTYKPGFLKTDISKIAK